MGVIIPGVGFKPPAPKAKAPSRSPQPGAHPFTAPAGKFQGNGMGGTGPSSIRARQVFLNRLGYKVAIDGKAGKFTNSAWQAHQTGFSPQHWNAFIAKHFTFAPTPAATPLPHGTGADTPPGSAAGAAPDSTSNPGYAAAIAQALKSFQPFNAGPQMAPATFATASANAQFDPQIQDLMNQLDTSRKQGPSNIKQILDWYGKVVDAARNAGSSLSASDAALISAAGGADAHALEAFGGSASPGAEQAAGYQSIVRGGLAGQSMADVNYLNKLPAIYALQGADAARRQSATDRNAQSDLLSKLVAAKTAKGSAFTSALGSAQENSLKDRLAIANENDTRRLLPFQVAQAGQNLTSGSLTNQYKSDQVTAIEQKINEATQGQNFDTLQPTQISSLSASVESGLVTKKGQLVVPPTNAGAIIDAAIAGSGFSPKSTNVRVWRQNLMRGLIARWNAQHPKRPYRINPKTDLVEPVKVKK